MGEVVTLGETPATTELNSEQISGLAYVNNYVDDLAEAELLTAIDAEHWLADLTRRVQHYGYRYDYKARKVVPSMFLGALPRWTAKLVDSLTADGYMSAPDQLIVNEYTPGQGISSHVDCVSCFGPVVCSISLGSSCVMKLSAVNDSRQEMLFLEPRSLLVLSGESRLSWRHAIPARKSDTWNSRVIRRGRRVSLTFRTVILHSSAIASPATATGGDRPPSGGRE